MSAPWASSGECNWGQDDFVALQEPVELGATLYDPDMELPDTDPV